MTAIVWLRRSMRVRDNTALVEASHDHEEVIPFYVVDTDYFDSATLGYPRVRFWRDSLLELKDLLQERGSDLIVRQGKPLEQLGKIVAEADADAVYFNRDYSPYARERDGAIREELDCGARDWKDIVLAEKREILTNKGEPYRVYSYYQDKWFDMDFRRPREPSGITTPSLESGDVPSLDELGFEEPDGFEWLWDAGRSGGEARLDAFMRKILHYDELRDLPARDATSRLSPHLKFGTVSIRECFWRAEEMRDEAPDTAGIDTWQEELAWRDFYFQVLWNWPETVDEPFLGQYASIDWRGREEAGEDWERFVEGRTGFPIVDAGMRQLRRTGWMHNRLRMIVTSFACKDLKLDWRDVHEYFKRWFVDAELAAMVGGIQWAYSIGTDAQPYFRVFNPWIQGEKFDPDGGAFIREMVPELEEVPDTYIHEPYTMPDRVQERAGCSIGDDYPMPMVDHDRERRSAIAMFREARGEADE